jgi:transcription-repair coupling factor (superfamily II helicase)
MTAYADLDCSVIGELPPGRQPVQTAVLPEQRRAELIQRVAAHCAAGQQAYWVCPLIEESELVDSRAASALHGELAEALPKARVGLIHGRMKAAEKEAVMRAFKAGELELLVATTVIEVGVDVPNATLMVIENAERMGLAQLHQLRGRVGRSHHQAYAYLLTPPRRSLSDDAQKRLDAVAALEALGSGFALATHDLEIRGAGELLGEGQSGQIQAIGFTLYNELLARAVSELRAGREPALDDPFHHGPEIETGQAVLIPEDYMPDVYLRLVLYKRIASAASQEELRDLEVEMINRFGLLAEPTKALFGVTSLKLLANRIGVEKLEASAAGGSIRFGRNAGVDPAALIGLVAAEPGSYSLDGPWRLRFKWNPPVPAGNRIERLERLLARLGATGDL